MSYYFCIVGTRDNPIYQADLASKPNTSSGPASFFSSNSTSTNTSSTATSNSIPGNSSNEQRGSIDSIQSQQSGIGGTSSGGGGVFGFGNALGALAGGLSAARESRNTYGGGAGQGSTTAGEGKGLGFGRYNDKDVLQMIAHSSLDVVEDKQFTNGAM